MLRRLMVLLCLACLLLCVASGALWALSYRAGPPVQPSNAPVAAQLARVMPQVNFSGTALADVFDFTRDVSGLTVDPDWAAVEAAGVARDQPVTLAVANTLVGEYLASLLSVDPDLVYAVRDNRIVVTIRDGLGRRPVGKPPGAPRTWEFVRGDRRWTLAVADGRLHVWRTPADPAAVYQAKPPGGVRLAATTVSSFLGVKTTRSAYPLHTLELDAPLWLLTAAAAVPPALWLLARLRRSWRRQPHQCPQCGYDLRATPDRCPECGYVPAPAQPAR